MKLFVTGVQSFIGKELIRQCDASGIQVEGMDLLESEDDRFWVGDIRDRNIAEKVPEDIDALVHLAALSRDADCRADSYAAFDVNVMGTLNMMNIAKQRGCRQFIFASTEWVYDSFEEGETKTEDSPIHAHNLKSEYALSKLVSEAALRIRYGHGLFPVTILRFGIVYGPRKENWSAVESIFRSVATKDEISVGSLNTGRHFVHVSDIAASIIKSVGLDGFTILNIQSSRLYTLEDIVTLGKKITGRSPIVRETSPDTPSVRRISNRKAGEVLKWEPGIDLETGLRSIMNHLV